MGAVLAPPPGAETNQYHFDFISSVYLLRSSALSGWQWSYLITNLRRSLMLIDQAVTVLGHVMRSDGWNIPH
jgi:hypothetical protein